MIQVWVLRSATTYERASALAWVRLFMNSRAPMVAARMRAPIRPA